MEKYVLTQDLVTGNELIDSEHRKIFDEVTLAEGTLTGSSAADPSCCVSPEAEEDGCVSPEDATGGCEPVIRFSTCEVLFVFFAILFLPETYDLFYLI